MKRKPKKYPVLVFSDSETNNIAMEFSGIKAWIQNDIATMGDDIEEMEYTVKVKLMTRKEIREIKESND